MRAFGGAAGQRGSENRCSFSAPSARCWNQPKPLESASCWPRSYPSVVTTANAATPAMDAVLAPLLLAGGLSPSAYTAAGTLSAHYRSPPTVCSTALHRRWRRLPLLAAAPESPSAPLPAASAARNLRCYRWVVRNEDEQASRPRGEAVDYYVATLAKVLGRLVASHRVHNATRRRLLVGGFVMLKLSCCECYVQ
jgi:hypothetical protein